jgi:hypothetical protein
MPVVLIVEMGRASSRVQPMSRDNRQKHDLHALDADGMVLCNPRDKEAAHRAEMDGSYGISGHEGHTGGSVLLNLAFAGKVHRP